MTGIPIRFDPETHTYTHIETRREIPGATSLLTSAGLSSPFIKNKNAATFGGIGHDTVRLYIRGELEEYDPAFEPWMEGIRQFVNDTAPTDIVCLDDTIVYSEKNGYCGMPDFIGKAYIQNLGRDRGLYNLDWKFWANATEVQLDDANIQLEAYSRAAIEMELIKEMPKKGVIHFIPGGYRAHAMTDPAAWMVFLSCLNIRRWKERH